MQDSLSRKSTPAKSFTDLFVWQRAHELVLGIYRLSEDFPDKELYGLTSSQNKLKEFSRRDG